jgi:hypothetical protein
MPAEEPESKMNQQSTTAGSPSFTGEMFLYSKPELLNARDHRGLGINPSKQPYAFAKSAKFAPIAAAEIVSAQRHYPIVFSSLRQPTLLAILSILDSDNLFVDENGDWAPGVYVPAYLRCHPFAVATRNDDQFSVVIDRASACIVEDAEQPFFDDKNELTAPIQARVDYCANYHTYLKSSTALGEKLAQLELLNGQQATFEFDGSGERQSSKTYIAVDVEKIGKMDAETLRALHADGTLSSIYAHLFSLDNWNGLLERYKQRKSTR